MLTDSAVSEFRNEAFTDFTRPENASAQQAALQDVGGRLGRKHPVVIGGNRIEGPMFASINPSHQDQVIGHFTQGTALQAGEAVGAAAKAFQSWQGWPPVARSSPKRRGGRRVSRQESTHPSLAERSSTSRGVPVG